MQTVTTIETANHYGKELTAEIVEFNAEVAAIKKARTDLIHTAAELRGKAASGQLEHAENLLGMIGELRGKQLALDVTEMQLLGRKNEFQKPILDARSAEKQRLAKLMQKRTDEIVKGLQKVSPECRWGNGVINEDGQMRGLKQAAAEVTPFVKVVTPGDELRARELSQRVASLVPSFADNSTPSAEPAFAEYVTIQK